jgi:protein TonB
MFESTLEAQGLHDGERRLGTLSAAALAHLGIGLAIVAATALIVPQVRTPEAVSPIIVVAPGPPLDDVSPRPVTRAPKQGAAAQAGTTVPAPRAVLPDTAPAATSESLPAAAPDTAPQGPTGGGEGAPGDPDGSASGVPGGTGTGEAGPGDGQGRDPVELTGDMVRPVLLEKVEPSYPQVARRAGLGGRVTLRAVIAPDGGVESVEVFSSTNPLFNEAAVEAVRRWRYRPAVMNGRPVRVYFSVVVDFLVR